MGVNIFGKEKKEIGEIVNKSSFLTVSVTGYLIKLGNRVTISLLLSLLIWGVYIFLVDVWV